MKTRKWLGILSLLVLLAVILGSCAKPTPEVTKEVTEEVTEEAAAPTEPIVEEELVLTIQHDMGTEDPQGLLMESFIEEFEEVHPNIDVKVELTPSLDMFMKAETSFLAGKEADLIMQNYMGAALGWLDSGLAIPLNDLVDEWGLEGQFLDVAIGQNTDSEGRIACLPMQGYNWPIWYNMKILNESGVDAIPTTIEELLDASEKIRAAGYQPFATGGTDWTGARDFQLVLMSHLTTEEIWSLFAEGGFSSNPNAVSGIETFVQLRDSGVFVDNVEGLEFSSRTDLFFSGQAAMMHGGSWNYASTPEELTDHIILGGMPLPIDSPYDKPTWWSGYLVKGVFVTRNGSKNLEAVGEFIKFLFQPENIARVVEGAAVLPSIKDVPVDESKLTPLLIQSLPLVDELTSLPLIEEIVPGPIFELWDKAANDAYVPGMTAEEILESLDILYEEISD
jgi:multiple sugar transport system substrate-binding protein